MAGTLTERAGMSAGARPTSPKRGIAGSPRSTPTGPHPGTAPAVKAGPAAPAAEIMWA